MDGMATVTGRLCAACGIIISECSPLDGEPPSNGVCCPACLTEYPELMGMGRDEVIVWHWQRWGAVVGVPNASAGVAAARAWLRVQARLGRDDDTIADVAVAAFGLSMRQAPRLRRYVAALRQHERVTAVVAA